MTDRARGWTADDDSALPGSEKIGMIDGIFTGPTSPSSPRRRSRRCRPAMTAAARTLRPWRSTSSP